MNTPAKVMKCRYLVTGKNERLVSPGKNDDVRRQIARESYGSVNAVSACELRIGFRMRE